MEEYLLSLNPAQQEAVRTLHGPVLVVAGAGSGKTKTIVHRIAHMVHNGIPASSILLLTFTKKVATEMLLRATHLLGQSIGNVQGGTFHSFAYMLLRIYHPNVLAGKTLTIMDTSDSVEAIHYIRDTLKIGKGERGFPKNQSLLSYISKTRNKEISIEELLKNEAFHLIYLAEDIQRIAEHYEQYKRKHDLLDYDDLLFVLENVLLSEPVLQQKLHERYKYIMVDEYQDTNKIQARLLRLITGESSNIMAVGDDAQSIYAFRGATVQNILDFPKYYPNTKIIKLEENYRSKQPILAIANAILSNALTGYKKELYTKKEGGAIPTLYRTKTDRTQTEAVVDTIITALREYPPSEIAILVRAGYQSYPIELELNKKGITFKKYGGATYTEAAHVKDCVAFLRVYLNPHDYPAMQRIVCMCKGIGEKTARKIFEAYINTAHPQEKEKLFTKYPEVATLLESIEYLKSTERTPLQILRSIFDIYQPYLEKLYPEDWVRRVHGLEQIEQMASFYTDVSLLLSDLSLNEVKEKDELPEDAIVISTIHSAKGLEWSVVLLIDLVEDRFPSRQSLTSSEDLEEERRLMYVACTRAKEHLYLFAPSHIFPREKTTPIPVTLSPFIREIPSALYIEQKEQFSATYAPTYTTQHTAPFPTEEQQKAIPTLGTGFCYHKQFGKGKVLQELDEGKIRVLFPSFGMKTILREYLYFDEDATHQSS